MKKRNSFLILLLAAGVLTACDDATDSGPTKDVLKVIVDNPEPEKAAAADMQTECLPSGVSRTHFVIGGNDIDVTFVRANYIVVLSHVIVRGTNGIEYGGEVEIILPDQTRVYNVMKNSELQPRDTFNSFAFMGTLTSIALHERYTICAAQDPSAFWRPKDIPPAPPLPEVKLP